MKKLVAIHSFKGGTGKSYLAANLSTIYALQGKKVCLLDMDFRAPTQHVVFEPKEVKHWLNDVMNGSAEIKDCIIDCSDKIENKGKLFVGFADFSTEAIREMISKGRKWETEALQRILLMRKDLLEKLDFDVCIADTSPGIQYSSINAVVAADVAVVVSTLDDSDIYGTAKMINELYEVFQKRVAIIINKAIGGGNMGDLERAKIVDALQEKYKQAIIGVLPCYCEVGKIKRASIFSYHYPKHPFTEMLRMIAAKLDML
ncbi:MAG: AAA family ATPase [Candidatus Verstraetearchaeota archaeon]|nr:AAA family ATPase [Candidatus Verstraetearchaeota archaeon]